MNSRSKSELALDYGVGESTFRKWLKTIGMKTGKRKILTPKEVQQVYTALGMPG